MMSQRPWMIGHESHDDAYEPYLLWEQWVAAKLTDHLIEEWELCDGCLLASLYAIMCEVADGK